MKNARWIAAALLLVPIAAGVWWMTRPAVPATGTQVASVPDRATPPQPAPPASAPATGAQPAGAPAAKPSASGATGKRVQQRLDAIAQAYEQGDARAMERALWPNHAAVRPDGERLDRRQVLAVWAEEWEAFSNRDLKFYVEDVIEDAGKATVVWAILLTADLTDANGDPHHLMVNGKQQATIVGAGDSEQLEGPIEYTTFERKLDGNAWPLD